MDIKSESDITGQVARDFRIAIGKSQSEFWNPLGVRRMTGANYEAGRNRIPAPTRRLLFVHYVAGIDVTVPADEMVAQGQLLRSVKEASQNIEVSVKQARQAVFALETATMLLPTRG